MGRERETRETETRIIEFSYLFCNGCRLGRSQVLSEIDRDRMKKRQDQQWYEYHIYFAGGANRRKIGGVGEAGRLQGQDEEEAVRPQGKGKQPRSICI